MDANGWIIVCPAGHAGDAGTRGDCTLYVERSERKLISRGTEENLPKRPNDGTQRDTVASGWFEDDGGFPEFSSQPWYPFRERIGSVCVSDRWAPKSCRYLFDGLTSCERFDLVGLDTSRSESLEGMFRGCASVDQLLDIDRFDTSHVRSVAYMFMNCLKLRAVSVAGWNTSGIGDASHMFSGCSPYVLADDGQEAFLSKIVGSSGSHGSWFRASL